ncbi:MAG: hypothetical protein R2729_10140 [Bryobacteraceae bacterium]
MPYWTGMVLAGQLLAAAMQVGAIWAQEGVMHEGQPAVRVSTPAATWIYHTEGAGFGSLLDRDGRDWISWRPGARSAGEFRGIPNLGAVAHPGYTGERGAKTSIGPSEAGSVRLRSVSADRRWEMTWDVRADRADLTIDNAGEPYWFLYEGTPAGRLHIDKGYWGLPDGVRRSPRETWDRDIEGREWVYFGDADSPRVLLLVNHQDDSANDQFWQMEGNMTVWGFGRQYRCCGRYLTATPARYTVRLVESADFPKIKAAAEEILAQ